MGWHSAQEIDDDAYPIQHDEVDEQLLVDYAVRQQIAQDNIESD